MSATSSTLDFIAAHTVAFVRLYKHMRRFERLIKWGPASAWFKLRFAAKDDGGDGEVVLNLLSLVSKEKEVKGRFTLYPTENMYNFLLLDQIDGDVYQVQWSLDLKKRGVIPIR